MSTRGYLDRGWLVLATGLAVAVLLTALWLIRAPMPFLPEPAPVAPGEVGSTGSAGYTLRELTTLEAVPNFGETEPPMPGASFVMALIDYQSRDGSDVSCMVYLLGEGRQWTNPRTVSAKDLGHPSYCEGASGTVVQIFEIPASAVPEIRGVQILGGGGTAVLAGEVRVQ